MKKVLGVLVFLKMVMTSGEKLQLSKMFMSGETPEYAGLAVSALAADPKRHSKTGRILITADLGDEYGFVDVDSRYPANIRGLSSLFKIHGWEKTSEWIPSWVKVPGWLLTVSSSKF